MSLRLFAATLLYLLGAGPTTLERAVIPAGTAIPIRFLHPLRSGKDSVGARVLVQTMAAGARDSCVIAPAYGLIGGRLVISSGGRLFAGRGQLEIQFDSLQTQAGDWVSMDAVLDSLEWAPPKSLSDSGRLLGSRSSITGRAVPAGVAAATGIGLIPVAALGGFSMIRRGPRAEILAGETGSLRLTDSLALVEPTCRPIAGYQELVEPPKLPQFPTEASDETGTKPGDLINLILLGPQAGVDSAFARADWVAAESRSALNLTEGVGAAILKKSDRSAPVSTEYFEGRPEIWPSSARAPMPGCGTTSGCGNWTLLPPSGWAPRTKTSGSR